MHGGIPSPEHSGGLIENINEIAVPLRDPEIESPMAWEIMWSDPVGYVFCFLGRSAKSGRPYRVMYVSLFSSSWGTPNERRGGGLPARGMGGVIHTNTDMTP